MTGLTKLERDVLQNSLIGEHALLTLLRMQIIFVIVKIRTLSGVGFWTDLDLPDHVERCNNRSIFRLGCIGRIEGLENPIGFIVLVEDGALSQIEGYTHAEDWPEKEFKYELLPPKTDDVEKLQQDAEWFSQAIVKDSKSLLE